MHAHPQTHPSTARERGLARGILASAVVGALVVAGVVLAPRAHAAELTPVPKGEYLLAAVSSESSAYPAPPALDGTALGAFDGDYTTQWVSKYAATPPAPAPHWISLDLQRPISIKALDYSGKVGQRIAAKNVEVYVTNDAAVAGTSPADGAWGAPVAESSLHAPTSNTEEQRIELDDAQVGRYVALVILEAQDPAGKGGGAGEIEVLSDQELPPIPADPGPSVEDTVQITNGDTSADVATAFPQVVSYSIGGTDIGGQTASIRRWAVNGRSYASATTSTSSPSGVDYVSRLTGIDVTVHSSIRIDDDGVVRFDVTAVDGTAAVTTLGLPDNAFLSTTSAHAGSTLDRTVISPDRTTNADEHIAVTEVTATGETPAAYAFLGNGEVIGSVLTNATTQASGDQPGGMTSNPNASWNTRLITRVTEADGRTAEIGSNTWLIHPSGAVDDRVTSYELPQVTVLFAKDRNADGIVDWQDAGIRYREVDTPRLGADRVADRVVSRIPFNFASTATNYFDLTLDNTKRIANQTDGLGQWVLNKGFGSEGHDSANTDYGDNFNDRAGGLADFTHLVEEGAKLNADMSVHVNATEMYPQSNAFDTAIIDGAAPYKPMWNWLDQSYGIDQQADLGTGRVLDRFQQLRDAVPGLSGVYIDVYYSNGWVAEELANQLHSMGLEVATEWGDKFVDNTVWSHWPNDLSYGGATNKGINSTMVRFIQNGQADIWNDDVLLGQQRLVDAEGWVGNRNWDGFIDNVWTQSLPTKFIQQSDLLTYTSGVSATLTNDVAISVDAGTRVITMDGATVLRGDSYLLPWQSLASNDQAGSPVDADKMYFYSASGGTKTFGLTDAFRANTAFDVFTLGDQGRQKVGTVNAVDGQLTLSGDKATAYVVVPQGGAQRAAEQFHDAGLNDPGFNSGSLTAWNPTGDVTLARTAVGAAKNASHGDNIAVFGSAASSIGQTVTGLTAGARYTFSAQVQIDPTATREVTISAGEDPEDARYTWNLSPTLNYTRADSKAGQHYQRASVSFVAPPSGEAAVRISAVAGEVAVRIDNARIMTDTTAPHAAGTAYSNDFEGNQPGWGPFVKGDVNGIDDPRTSISRRHDPYTTSAWRNTAKPYAPDGTLAGLALDTTLAGDHSLLSHHEENKGILYRTDPTQLPLQAGHSYRVNFTYQVGASGAYSWVTGTDVVVDGAISTTTLRSTRLAQALTTTAFTQDVVGGCGDYTWVGLETAGGQGIDFVLDDFTVTDLGPTPGGSPCATVGGSTVELAPGAQTLFTTTFINGELTAAANVAVQLSVPDGYAVQVAAGSSNLFSSVAPRQAVETKWLITAPLAAAGTSVNVDMAATYLVDCEVRTTATAQEAAIAPRPRISNAQITVVASSEETTQESTEAAKMLDGDRNTFWHSRWSTNATSYPHVLTFDLGSVAQVDGISYLRRGAHRNGPIKDYQVAVSTDGQFYSDVTAGQWQDISTWQDVNFDAVSARYVRVTATSSISGTQFAAVAEMAIYGTAAPISGHAAESRPADDPTTCTPAGPVAFALDAGSAHAGDAVGASLTNAVPSSSVSFWLDDRRIADATVGADGTYRAALLVPVDAEPGPRQVTVRNADGSVIAHADLTVEPPVSIDSPSLTPSVDSVVAGQSLDVQLRGFSPGVTVDLWLHSGPVRLGSVVVSAAGEATVRVTIPEQTLSGEHSIEATDGTGAGQARASITVTTPSSGTAVPTAGASPHPLASTGGDQAAAFVALTVALLLLGGGLLLRRYRRHQG